MTCRFSFLQILFPPLTTLEVIRTRIDGSALVVLLRPTVNRNNMTIEQVVSKMKLSSLQLISSLASELAFVGAPSAALRPFRSLEHALEHEDDLWFNDSSHYLQATQDVMLAQRKALSLLTALETWTGGDEGGGSVDDRRVMTVAEKCARLEAHGTAAALVRMAAGASSRRAQDGTEPSAGCSATVLAALRLLDRGLESPWPKTLVKQLEHATEDELCVVQRRLAGLIEATPKFEAGCCVLVRHPLYRWISGTVLAALPDGRFEVEMHASRGVERFTGGKALGHESVCAIALNGPGALLREAAAVGELRLVECILGAGTNCCFAASPSVELPLHHAVRAGHASVCAALVRAAPASANVPDMFGQTPKGLAMERGNPSVLRVLEPSALDKEFAEGALTPLMLAAHGGDLSAVQALVIDQGIDACQAISANGTTALSAAAEQGHETIVSALLPLNTDTVVGTGGIDHDLSRALLHPLLLAVRNAHETVARMLLAAGAPLNFVDQQGRSALLHAAGIGHAGVCKLLVNARAECHHADAAGLTALMIAAMFGHLRVVEVLLETRTADGIAAVETTNAALEGHCQKGLTALHYASRGGHAEVCRALLHAKAACDEATRARSETPLHLASQYGHASTVLLLLDVRASPEKQDLNGRTCLMLASRDGHARCILEIGLRPLGWLVLDLVDPKGFCALTFASRDGHVAACAALLRAGAFPDREDGEGKTPLAWAVQNGHPQIVRQLLEAGASIGPAGQHSLGAGLRNVGGDGNTSRHSSSEAMLASGPSRQTSLESPRRQRSSLRELATQAAAELQGSSRAADFTEVAQLLEGAHAARSSASAHPSHTTRHARGRLHQAHGAGDFTDAAHLKQWLQSQRLDLTLWNVGLDDANKVKSVEQLFEELQKEESVIGVDREGVMRLVALAKVRVVLRGRPEKVLHEDSRTVKRTGHRKHVGKLPWQKMRAADDPIEAAQRGVLHKLADVLRSENDVLILSDTLHQSHERRESDSYPGLNAGYELFTVTAVVTQLPEDEFTTSEQADGEALAVRWCWRPSEVGAYAFEDVVALGSWLSRQGVNMASWGTEGAKPVHALWLELQQQQCVLTVDTPTEGKAGAVVRHVQKVEVRISLPDRPGLVLHLAESGAAEDVVMASLLQETVAVGENLERAARRGLIAQLGGALRPEEIVLAAEEIPVRTETGVADGWYPDLRLDCSTYTIDATVAGLPMEAFDTHEYSDARRLRVKRVLRWEWRPRADALGGRGGELTPTSKQTAVAQG